MPYADPMQAKEYRREYHRLHGAETAEERRAYQRERVRWRRRVLSAALDLEPCARCGKAEGPRHWHHLDPEQKVDSVSQLASRSWNVVLDEMQKCEVVCVSCHHRAHHRERNFHRGRGGEYGL